MSSADWMDFAKPDELRTFPHGRIELLHVGNEPVVAVDWFGATSYAKKK